MLKSRREDFEARVCVTGQHRQMLDAVLEVFRITPHHDLNAMLPGQTLFQSTARILGALEAVFDQEKPHMTLVQGDTTSTFCGALASFYRQVPVGHVEAGLRTWDMQQPFPEEMNRVLATRLTALHFAPTQGAATNLLHEGVPADRVEVTGNTGIDAVLSVARELESGALQVADWPWRKPDRKMILVTAHRRESFGEGFVNICQALRSLADRDDVQVVYPVHPNPNVRQPVNQYLEGHPNIVLIEPQDYLAFVDLMRRSYLLLTDSGGVQEEGPSLGKPILVMREKTERPEAVEAGTVRLVGTDVRKIVGEAIELLENRAEYQRRSQIHNPYGDGRACERIADAILRYFG